MFERHEEFIQLPSCCTFVLSYVAKDNFVKVRYQETNNNNWFYLTSNDGRTFYLPSSSDKTININVRYLKEKKMPLTDSTFSVLENWK